MGRYKYTIKGENLNFGNNEVGLQEFFEETLIRKQKWEGKTVDACNHCMIGYHYSCLDKKVNRVDIECEGHYFFVSSTMDFLTLAKKRRF